MKVCLQTIIRFREGMRKSFQRKIQQDLHNKWYTNLGSCGFEWLCHPRAFVQVLYQDLESMEKLQHAYCDLQCGEQRVITNG